MYIQLASFCCRWELSTIERHFEIIIVNRPHRKTELKNFFNKNREPIKSQKLLIARIQDKAKSSRDCIMRIQRKHLIIPVLSRKERLAIEIFQETENKWCILYTCWVNFLKNPQNFNSRRLLQEAKVQLTREVFKHFDSRYQFSTSVIFKQTCGEKKKRFWRQFWI